VNGVVTSPIEEWPGALDPTQLSIGSH
jgi:hypothetical protein